MSSEPQRESIGAFEPLGLSDDEERTYRALVGHPGSTYDDLRLALGAGTSRVRVILNALERKGLVSRVPGPLVRFFPTRPDAAIESMISVRQRELEAARVAALRLLDTYRANERRGPLDLVEVIGGREAVVRRFGQLQRQARSEVLCFTKPPFATRPSDAGESVLDRGVNVRCVYDVRALEIPDVARVMDSMIARGEQARTHPAVPMKLFLVDRRAALLPVHIEAGTAAESALIVHQSPLLDAVVMLFEFVWTQAVPLASTDSADAQAPSRDVRHSDDDLLRLLIAGLKEEAIARQLGVSVSTVRRRVRRLLNDWGVQTKMQLAFKLAEQRLAHGERVPVVSPRAEA